MAMTNMKMSPKAQTEMMSPTKVDAPEYPWGLRISLNNDSLEKLGVGDLPAVGSELTIQCKVKVTSVSMDDSEGGGKNKRVELQITDMGIGSDEPEMDRAGALYGK